MITTQYIGFIHHEVLVPRDGKQSILQRTHRKTLHNTHLAIIVCSDCVDGIRSCGTVENSFLIVATYE